VVVSAMIVDEMIPKRRDFGWWLNDAAGKASTAR
jgi:hypothetical protein